MGIKDKVLDILFDDNNDIEREYHEDFSIHKNKVVKTKSLSDTGSIFIDATSPLPKVKQNIKQVQEDSTPEPKILNDNGYQMSENISPIFGPIDNKNKKSKNYSKIKSYNEISNKNYETASKPQSQPYTSVVISPFYGPISTKPVKKVSKPRKKSEDPFDRNINDTGSFDAVLAEQEEQNVAPEFDDVKEDVVEQADAVGDTDRLDKISDRINKIKNEAASIYSDESSDSEEIAEDGYEVETMNNESISDLIHKVQKHDGKIEHYVQNHIEDTTSTVAEEGELPVVNDEPTVENEPVVEPTIEDEPIVETTVESEPVVESTYNQEDTESSQEFTEDMKSNESSNEEIITNIETKPVEETTNTQVSVDDLFDEEDETEEGKDLFSVLFGDE